MNTEDATLMIEQAFITLGGREILHSAGIRVTKGKITGLLGSNGSGKSTLLQMLFGSLKGADPIVSYNNKRLRCQAFRVLGLVNYLPQYAILPSGISMARLAVLFSVSLDELFSYFPELKSELKRTVYELSGGQVRLWQAVLLILAPTRFTLLDEPFTHLAPVYIEQLRSMLRQLAVRKGLLLTDHMYVPLLSIADEMWFMKSGQTFLLRHTDDLILHGYVRSINIS